jgi:hypothetical protein
MIQFGRHSKLENFVHTRARTLILHETARGYIF